MPTIISQIGSKTWTSVQQQLNYHIHNLRYYGDFVEYHRLYFGNHHVSSKLLHHRINPSIVHHLIPLWLMVVFGVRAFFSICFEAQLDTLPKRMLIGTEMFPLLSRRYMEVTIVVWTFINLCNIFYVLRKSIVYYKFMAVYVVSPASKIKPQSMGLSQADYQKFDKFRNALLRVFNITIWSIAGGVALIFVGRTIAMDLPYSVEWFVLLVWAYWVTLFAIYISYTAYLYAVITMIIGYYIQLKQRSIIEQVDCLSQLILTRAIPNHPDGLNSVVRQFFQLNRRYTTLLAEIADYNRFLTRSLSVIFFFYTMIIAYCVYLVVVTNVQTDVKQLYVGIFMSHAFSLAGLILACQNICYNNKRFGASILRFYNLALESNIAQFEYRKLIKIQQFLENTISNQLSFTLINDYLIDSRSYYAVFYNISTFFFLIFKPYENISY